MATLTNAGSVVEALPVTFAPSDGFDRASLRIGCFGPAAGARCSQDANDPLRFTVTLQPGRALTWLASARVRADAKDGTVTFSIASAAGSTDDTNALVVFRDGFDACNGDGTQAPPLVEGESARAVLDADGWIDVALPASIGATPTPVLIVRGAACEVRVEARSLADAVLARLFERSADGGERASAWSAARSGATLSLASVAPDASSLGAPHVVAARPGLDRRRIGAGVCCGEARRWREPPRTCPRSALARSSDRISDEARPRKRPPPPGGFGRSVTAGSGRAGESSLRLQCPEVEEGPSTFATSCPHSRA